MLFFSVLFNLGRKWRDSEDNSRNKKDEKEIRGCEPASLDANLIGKFGDSEISSTKIKVQKRIRVFRYKVLDTTITV